MKDEKSPVEILLEEADGDIEKLKTIIIRIEGELELTRKERDNEKRLKEFYEKMHKSNFCAFKRACMYFPGYADLEWIGGLIEKEKPKKLDYEGDGYVDGELNYDTAICRSCGRKFEVDYDEHSKYCPECGQKLDWGEKDD